MGGISVWQLVVVALIIVLLFGTKNLRGLGSDLGAAINGFKRAIKDVNKEVDNDSCSDKASLVAHDTLIENSSSDIQKKH